VAHKLLNEEWPVWVISVDYAMFTLGPLDPQLLSECCSAANWRYVPIPDLSGCSIVRTTTVLQGFSRRTRGFA
jgi:hypothetical protein